MCYYNQEDFATALTKFSTSISSYPIGQYLVDAWYYRAHCKYNLESYTFAQAKADYQSIITNFPNSDKTAHARYYLGNCESNLGNYLGAIAAYQAFIAADPTTDWVANARDRIAGAYYSDQDYNNALTAYVNYYTLYPGTKAAGDAHYWAGRCYEKLFGTVANSQAHSEYCTVITQYPNCEKLPNAIVHRDAVGNASCP